MHEPCCVRRVQGGRHLAADRQRARRIERPLGAKKRPEVGSLDVPHGEVDPAVDVPSVIDRHHVRVLERHRDLRLARETLVEALVEREVRGDELQRDRPLEPQVIGAVDDSHSAPSDELLDAVAEELRADLKLGMDVHGSQTSDRQAYA
jgi:hypothetical protein